MNGVDKWELRSLVKHALLNMFDIDKISGGDLNEAVGLPRNAVMPEERFGLG